MNKSPKIFSSYGEYLRFYLVKPKDPLLIGKSRYYKIGAKMAKDVIEKAEANHAQV